MKKLFEKIVIIIDKSGKILSRFKTIGAIIIIVMLVMSLINNGCSKQEANELFEKVTGLNIQNDILQKDVKENKAIIVLKDSLILNYQDSLVVARKEKASLKHDNGVLQDEYNDIAKQLIKIPVEESYEFLDCEAYPYAGKKEFPFNIQQVKGFHSTYLERLLLLKKEMNLTAQINNCEYQLLLKDAVYKEKESQYKIFSKNAESYEEIIINKNEEIILKDEYINKKDNRNLLWKIVAGVLAAIAIIK